MGLKLQTITTIHDLLSLIKSPLRTFAVGKVGGGYFVQVVFDAPCAVTGQMQLWKGRKWYVSAHATDSEIVQTCFKALLTSLEHEARETFTYKGVAILAPHFDVEKLVHLAQDEKNMDVRE